LVRVKFLLPVWIEPLGRRHHTPLPVIILSCRRKYSTGLPFLQEFSGDISRKFLIQKEIFSFYLKNNEKTVEKQPLTTILRAWQQLVHGMRMCACILRALSRRGENFTPAQAVRSKRAGGISPSPKRSDPRAGERISPPPRRFDPNGGWIVRQGRR